MSENKIPIPSRIYNAAVGGHVCGPDDIDFGQKVVHLIKYDKDGNEVSFESQVTQTNKIYVIHDDFILTSNVTIPANCILEFDGGSINGAYTITGANTGIQAGLVKIFNTDIILAGTWNVAEVYPEWFGAKGDGIADDTNALIKVFSLLSIFKTLNIYNSYRKVSEIVLGTTENVSIVGNGKIINDNCSGIGGYFFGCTININFDLINHSTFDVDVYGLRVSGERNKINALIETSDGSLYGKALYCVDHNENTISGKIYGNYNVLNYEDLSERSTHLLGYGVYLGQGLNNTIDKLDIKYFDKGLVIRETHTTSHPHQNEGCYLSNVKIFHCNDGVDFDNGNGHALVNIMIDQILKSAYIFRNQYTLQLSNSWAGNIGINDAPTIYCDSVNNIVISGVSVNSVYLANTNRSLFFVTGTYITDENLAPIEVTSTCSQNLFFEQEGVWVKDNGNNNTVIRKRTSLFNTLQYFYGVGAYPATRIQNSFGMRTHDGLGDTSLVLECWSDSASQNNSYNYQIGKVSNNMAFKIYDTDRNAVVTYKIRRVHKDVNYKGTTSERPTSLLNAEDAGFVYIDTTLNDKPIYWTGSAWVDATGTQV